MQKPDKCFQFPSEVTTCSNGNQVLANFYNYCCQHSNCRIELDWNGLNLMDANLSALLLAMIHKLKKERKLDFFLDYECLRGGLSIFWRNGLAHYIYKKQDKPLDARESTVPVKAFKSDDVNKFADYIERDLLKHRGMDVVAFPDQQKVKNSYFELFNNYELHAKTEYPVLVCGQLFPKQKELKFTLVDMGVGFLKNISVFTQNTDKPITTAVEAIKWAVNGGSTKTDALGGTGLRKILTYCMKNQGALHIVSDDCYWEFEGKTKGINSFKIKNPFVGTTIHLIFRFP